MTNSATPQGTGLDAGTEEIERLRTRAADLLERSRARSSALTDVDDTELVTQHSPLMSPLVWDLAHIGSQEELWLVRDVGGRTPLRPEIDGLYDAFQHTRSSRVELPLLSPGRGPAVRRRGARQGARRARREPVARAAPGARGVRVRDDRAARAAARRDDARHAPAARRRRRCSTPPSPPRPRTPLGPSEVLVPGGRVRAGHVDRAVGAGQRAARRTRSSCPAFVIDAYPVTNAQYAAFVDAGGYDDRAVWTRARLGAPPSRPGWRRRGSGAATPTARGGGGASASSSRCRVTSRSCTSRSTRPRVRALGGQAAADRGGVGEGGPVRPGDRPVPPLPVGRRGPDRRARQPRPAPPAARAGRRLPGGRVGARRAPDDRRRLGVVRLRLAPVPGLHDVPVPGVLARSSSAGTTRVLRGGSFGTDASAIRATFRNWDHPVRRQIFSGFRLARDAGPADAGR